MGTVLQQIRKYSRTYIMTLHPCRAFLAGCLLAVSLLGGCRTYGGYGSEAATYAQIQKANQRFEQDLARAQAELSTLESASEPLLQTLADRFARIVEAHEAILDEHKQLAEQLSEGSSYRALHRTYGAIVVEQRVLRAQYQELLEHVYDAFPADTTSVTAVVEQPYALIPPYYARISAAGRSITVNDVLRRVRSGARPEPGFMLSMPSEGPEEPHSTDPRTEPAGQTSSGGGHD